MTQEEKDLLFKDLCARLPHKVLVSVRDFDGDDMTDILRPYTLNIFNGREDKIKPYLRPMSSMTEEEYQEFGYDVLRYTPREFDWLNAHHFDYRNLIEKGLALEAPEGMYKEK